MIMKLSKEQISKKPEDERGGWHFKLNIVHLSIFEIRHLKEINIYYQIERLIGDDEKIWINDYDDEADLYEGVEMKHIINLNIDVITMISKKEKDDE